MAKRLKEPIQWTIPCRITRSAFVTVEAISEGEAMWAMMDKAM